MHTLAWKFVTGLALLFALPAASLFAQTFPDRPIRILVGVPPGAGPDVEARQFAAQFALQLGQPVIVENRPGFSQMLAIEALSKAPADGYTLATVQPSNMAANPRLYDRPLYNVDKDFTAISLLGEHPWVLYVNSKVPAKNLEEFVALAKSTPGKLTYASTGIGSFGHLTTEWLQKILGVSLTHIPYGASGWQGDFLAGNVDVVLFPLITMTDHVKSGKIRALAISSTQRSPLLPDVPTFAEAKYPDYTVRAWFGLMAPVGLPGPILNILNGASIKAAQTQEFRDFFAQNGASAAGGSAVDFDKYLKSEQLRWRTVITDSNIKLD